MKKLASKKVIAACATLDSSVHSGLIFSSTHTLVFLYIYKAIAYYIFVYLYALSS